jgi:hypothetical protein
MYLGKLRQRTFANVMLHKQGSSTSFFYELFHQHLSTIISRLFLDCLL